MLNIIISYVYIFISYLALLYDWFISSNLPASKNYLYYMKKNISFHQKNNKKINTVPRVVNPRTDGGRISAPRRFFVDNGKTAARSAAKLGMTIPSSFLHMMYNFWLPNLKGQVTRSVWMTRPHIIILQLWDRVGARVDDLGLWNLQGIMTL